MYSFTVSGPVSATLLATVTHSGNTRLSGYPGASFIADLYDSNQQLLLTTRNTRVESGTGRYNQTISLSSGTYYFDASISDNAVAAGAGGGAFFYDSYEIYLSLQTPPVPIPPAAWLLGSGFLALLGGGESSRCIARALSSRFDLREVHQSGRTWLIAASSIDPVRPQDPLGARSGVKQPGAKYLDSRRRTRCPLPLVLRVRYGPRPVCLRRAIPVKPSNPEPNNATAGGKGTAETTLRRTTSVLPSASAR